MGVVELDPGLQRFVSRSHVLLKASKSYVPGPGRNKKKMHWPTLGQLGSRQISEELGTVCTKI